MPRIEAVIFDLDGVLVDSEPAHFAAAQRLIAPNVITDVEYGRLIGASSEAFMTWVRARYGIEASIADLEGRYTDLVHEELLAQRLPALDGAEALLGALRARGLPVAVASQSRPAWVADTLDSAGLASWFEVIVTAEVVTRPKPAPDIYLHTASLLGVAPAACLAVEDSVPGVAAAFAAGMRVVQTRQASVAPEVQPGARYVVDTLRAFDLDWLD